MVPVKPAKRRSSKNHSLDPLIFRGLKCFLKQGSVLVLKIAFCLRDLRILWAKTQKPHEIEVARHDGYLEDPKYLGMIYMLILSSLKIPIITSLLSCCVSLEWQGNIQTLQLQWKNRMMVINNPLVALGVALGRRPPIPIMISVPCNYWLELTRGIVPNKWCWPSNPSNLPLRAPCSKVVHARQNCEHFCTWWECKVMVSLKQKRIATNIGVIQYIVSTPPPRMPVVSKGLS